MVKVEKKYTVTLPFENRKGTARVYVYPWEIYGDKAGYELIEKYATKINKKESKREKRRNYKREWWNKESLTGITNRDRETLTRTGNELNDFEFKKYLNKLKELDGEERKKYTDSLKALPDEEFGTGNEGKRQKYSKVISQTDDEIEDEYHSECEE